MIQASGSGTDVAAESERGIRKGGEVGKGETVCRVKLYAARSGVRPNKRVPAWTRYKWL